MVQVHFHQNSSSQAPSYPLLLRQKHNHHLPFQNIYTKPTTWNQAFSILVNKLQLNPHFTAPKCTKEKKTHSLAVKQTQPHTIIIIIISITMASPSLLGSATSSFHGQSPLFKSPMSVRAVPRNGVALTTVKAAAGAAVLVEKSEAEKPSRLKATYIEKIIPKLKEEFSYQNILQVTNPFLLLTLFIQFIV